MTLPIRCGVVTVPVYKVSKISVFPGWLFWVIFPGTVVFECFCPEFVVEEGEIPVRFSYLSPPVAVPEDAVAW